MAFSRVWNNTLPVDTQLANQLGLDIRQLKGDIQERFGAVTGNEEDRPDLSTEAQPLSWTGFPFFAVDTKKMFRWNGAAWDDITDSFITPGKKVSIIEFVVDPVFDASLGTIFEITLTDNVTSSTLINVEPGMTLIFVIKQDHTGGWTFAWPDNVLGPGIVDPSSDIVCIQEFVVIGDSTVRPLTGMTLS